KCPKEDFLRKCLDQYIKGSVSFRDDFSAYNADLDVEYNKLFIHFPVAFVHPVDILDIQNTIKCGTKLNFPIVARSGGHSTEDYSIGDKDCYLVIDLVNLNKITIDPTSQTAIVETGNTLNPFYYIINRHGFAFPAGICPFIGVSGHILGGGIGQLSRKFGYSSDNILDAQIVLANGTVVSNAKEYPELFWLFEKQEMQAMDISYPEDYSMNISITNQLGNDFHHNLTFSISPKLQPNIYGIYLGSADELQPHIQEFIKLSKPKNVSYIENDLYKLIIYDSASLGENRYLKIKSLYIDSPGLSDGGVKYLMKFLESLKYDLIIEILLIGGRIDEIKRDETAFVHRGFMYHIGIGVDLHSKMCLRD
ncbi:18583_t:CDS:2, partial [Racocetra persica]